MVIRALCLALISLAVSTAVISQEAPEVSDVLYVRITNVDFVVSDAQGRFISGLTKADFEVYEDGKKQEITNFYEVRLRGGERTSFLSASDLKSTPRASLTTQKLILYFDNYSLSAQYRSRVIAASRDFIGRHLREGDQVMIATWSGSMKMRLPFTSDRGAIDAMLDQISKESAEASARDADRKLVQQQIDSMVVDETSSVTGQGAQYTFDMLMASGRRYAENVRSDLVKSSAALAKLMGTVSGMEGKKILIFASESFPAQPGGEIFQHLESVRQQAIRNPRSALGQSARAIQPLTEMAKFDSSSIIRSVGTAANASGVTIYALNPKPPDMGGDREGTAGRTDPVNLNVEFAKSIQGIDGLQVLASETGGLAVIGAPPDVAFAKIDEDLGSYYSIGYRTLPGQRAERSIEVRARKSGVYVRSRKNLLYRSAEAEMVDRVIANQLQSSPINDLGISLVADPSRAEAGKTIVPLKILIPISNLTLLPDGEKEIIGGFSVFVCRGDGKGDVSGVNIQSHKIRWPKEAIAHIGSQPLTFAVDVPIEGKRTNISVGVIDHLSQVTGFSNTRREGDAGLIK